MTSSGTRIAHKGAAAGQETTKTPASRLMIVPELRARVLLAFSVFISRTGRRLPNKHTRRTRQSIPVGEIERRMPFTVTGFFDACKWRVAFTGYSGLKREMVNDDERCEVETSPQQKSRNKGKYVRSSESKGGLRIRLGCWGPRKGQAWVVVAITVILHHERRKKNKKKNKN